MGSSPTFLVVWARKNRPTAVERCRTITLFILRSERAKTMSKALIAGINQVATDKGLDREIIFEAIEAALVSAYKRNYGSVANVSAEVDRLSGEMSVFTECEVVDDVFNERTEIAEEDAKKLVPTAVQGDVINVKSQPENFGRIAAQTAKQVIMQRIREAERDTVYENFAHRVGEIITGQVRNVDDASGAINVLLDNKHECLMMREDRIPNERVRRGDFLKVYVADVRKSTRGPVIKISRTHRDLLRRLMEQEIPEIREGIVEIKSIAREPGARSKAAVISTRPNVDPVGSCVGMKGLRIQNIVNELSGEKIDVVEWDDEPHTYIANALSPAKVEGVLLDDENQIKTATVIVPDRQLSLAIGKAGQNARLAAKLTGWRIDIKSATEAQSEGIDKLAQALTVAERKSGKKDLMDVAERLLLAEDQQAEDALARAVEALDKAQVEVQESTFNTLPPLDVFGEPLTESTEDAPELPTLPPEETVDAESAWAAAASKLQSEPELPTVGDFEAVEVEAPFGSDYGDEIDFDPGQPEPPAPFDADESANLFGDLPEIITADMLRTGRKKINFDSDDFEIPAELLVGLEEDSKNQDLAAEDEAGKKGKKKRKKGKR